MNDARRESEINLTPTTQALDFWVVHVPENGECFVYNIALDIVVRPTKGHSASMLRDALNRVYSKPLRRD